MRFYLHQTSGAALRVTLANGSRLRNEGTGALIDSRNIDRKGEQACRCSADPYTIMSPVRANPQRTQEFRHFAVTNNRTRES